LKSEVSIFAATLIANVALSVKHGQSSAWLCVRVKGLLDALFNAAHCITHDTLASAKIAVFLQSEPRPQRICCGLMHSCFSQLRARFRRTIEPRSFLVLNWKRMDDWGVFSLLISRVCSNKGQPHVTPHQANLCIVLLRPSKALVEEQELL
jgi:hypothetical protein